MREKPVITLPLPRHGGAPSCPMPWCGYRCGCCCNDVCQTPCPTPDQDGDCDCRESCHGGHEPWDCGSFSVRYDWVLGEADRLKKLEENQESSKQGNL